MQEREHLSTSETGADSEKAECLNEQIFSVIYRNQEKKKGRKKITMIGILGEGNVATFTCTSVSLHLLK